MATIRDVANRAGVSVTTVSHVINGTRYVEADTKLRVETAISALGYQPNLLARSLRSRRTHTLAVMVPDNSNPFFADISRVIEDVGFSEGYSVILCNSDRSDAKQAAYVDVLLSKQVDGIVVISSGSRVEPIQRIVRSGVPLVVVDRELGDLPVDQVLVDNELGGYQAGRYLVELGHRQIGCVVGPSDITPSAGRVAGFRRALEEAGVTLHPDAIARGAGQYVDGEVAMKELLERSIHITAVFVFNDLMAIGALAAIRRAGRRVPDEISVIGFDDIMQSSAMVPSLTTIAQPVAEIGRVSMQLLLDRIRHPDGKQPSRIILPTRLVERESCRALTERPGESAKGGDCAR